LVARRDLFSYGINQLKSVTHFLLLYVMGNAPLAIPSTPCHDKDSDDFQELQPSNFGLRASFYGVFFPNQAEGIDSVILLV
jgi:hypothetical protein